MTSRPMLLARVALIVVPFEILLTAVLLALFSGLGCIDGGCSPEWLAQNAFMANSIIVPFFPLVLIWLYVGWRILKRWGWSRPILAMALGLVFSPFLIGLTLVMLNNMPSASPPGWVVVALIPTVPSFILAGLFNALR